MIGLALLFGITVFMNGSTFAAIHGRFAQQLELSGSAAIPYIPWCALAIFIASVTAIRRIEKTRLRWLAFIIATLICNGITVYPILVLNHGSRLIVAKDEISRETLEDFKTRYPVKIVSYTSGEGHSIRVRKDQYIEGMNGYLAQLNKKKPNKAEMATPMKLSD